MNRKYQMICNYCECKEYSIRLPHVDDRIESEFNRLFEKGVNSELMSNVLSFVASKLEQFKIKIQEDIYEDFICNI